MAVAGLRGSGVGWIEEIGTSRFLLVLEETHLSGITIVKIL